MLVWWHLDVDAWTPLAGLDRVVTWWLLDPGLDTLADLMV